MKIIESRNHHQSLIDVAQVMSKRDPKSDAEPALIVVQRPEENATFIPAAALSSSIGLWLGCLNLKSMIRDPLHSRIVQAMSQKASVRHMDAWDFINPYGPEEPAPVTLRWHVLQGSLYLRVMNEKFDLLGFDVGAWSAVLSFYATMLGLQVGTLTIETQALVAHPNTVDTILKTENVDHYANGDFTPGKMINGDLNKWFDELKLFMEEGMVLGIKDRFFKSTGYPVFEIVRDYLNQAEDAQRAFDLAKNAREDWRKTLLGFALYRAPAVGGVQQ